MTMSPDSIEPPVDAAAVAVYIAAAVAALLHTHVINEMQDTRTLTMTTTATTAREPLARHRLTLTRTATTATTAVMRHTPRLNNESQRGKIPAR